MTTFASPPAPSASRPLLDEEDLCPRVVLHARPRQEKRLAADLDRAGVPYELFTVRRTRVYAHRRRTVDLPLLPSFLFARSEDAARVCDVAPDRVVGVVPVENQALLSSEIAAIRAALRAGMDAASYQGPAPDESTTVVGGPLAPILQGRVVRVLMRPAGPRLLLPVTAVDRMISVALPIEHIEPLSGLTRWAA